MDDNEMTLFDRLEIIRATDRKYDLRSNAYISFSGGKDSTVLSWLIDQALPGNQIPRVFIDTGIEYEAIRKFVRERESIDKRFVTIKPSKPIKQTLERVGYPFKSKDHSLRVEQFNKGSNAKFIEKYLGRTEYQGRYMCPKSLLYQFEEQGKYKYSSRCCKELKKKPVAKWARENGKTIAMTGMQREEGGARSNIGCAIIKGGKLQKFHPMAPTTQEWEEWLIRENKIELCELYYPPYNFKRTGCKGCPYAIELAEELAIMDIYMPAERRQCEIIWKYVYDEYRRIGYRLKRFEQQKLF